MYLFACWVIFHDFFVVCGIFLLKFKFLGPDLGPNCLQTTPVGSVKGKPAYTPFLRK